jgi:hypothetical protein
MKAKRSVDLAPHGFFLPEKGAPFDEIRLNQVGNKKKFRRVHHG